MSDCALATSILDTIGGTPLLELRRVVPADAGRILVKLESANPSGSMKDRMARAMIQGAERRGALAPGQPVVEYTGGSTGVSLALVCRATGHPLSLVTNDVVSLDKRRHMQALGAELTVIESTSGKLEASLTRQMIERAATIATERGAFWTDQFNNEDQRGGYHALGAEIMRQVDGSIDAFVQCVGTAGSLMGVAEALESTPTRIIAVEPTESPVLSGGAPGRHQIEGVGAGFVVPQWQPQRVDQIETVTTEAAMAMGRRLARDEAVFGGVSTGANVIAALRVAGELGPGRTVVTLVCDTGMKYLSGLMYDAAAVTG